MESPENLLILLFFSLPFYGLTHKLLLYLFTEASCQFYVLFQLKLLLNLVMMLFSNWLKLWGQEDYICK